MTPAQAEPGARTLVEVHRSRRIATPPDAALTLVAEAPVMLNPALALWIPVPDSEPSAGIAVEESQGRIAAHVIERLPESDPATRTFADRSTGITTRWTVEHARGGCKVRLTVGCEAPRSQARGLRDGLELMAGELLNGAALVATGFSAPSGPRPEALRRAVPPVGDASANIPASRTLAVPPSTVWAALTEPRTSADGRRFWVTPGPPDVGHWLCRTWARSAALLEVVDWQPLHRLGLRTLTNPAHPAVTTWTLTEVGDATLVLVNHRCATSHVGQPGSIEDELEALAHNVSRQRG